MSGMGCCGSYVYFSEDCGIQNVTADVFSSVEVIYAHVAYGCHGNVFLYVE